MSHHQKELHAKEDLGPTLWNHSARSGFLLSIRTIVCIPATCTTALTFRVVSAGVSLTSFVVRWTFKDPLRELMRFITYSQPVPRPMRTMFSASDNLPIAASAPSLLVSSAICRSRDYSTPHCVLGKRARLTRCNCPICIASTAQPADFSYSAWDEVPTLVVQLNPLPSFEPEDERRHRLEQ